jgi:LacI family transcriptional regulator
MTRGRDRELLKGVAGFARMRPEWSLLLRPVMGRDQWTPRALAEYDGIIARVRDAKLDEWLAQMRLPAINVADALERKRLPFVGTDELRAGELAGEYLLGLGYRQVAFYGDLRLRHAQGRLEGLARTLRARNLHPPLHFGPVDSPVTDTHSEGTGELAAWLKSLPRPSAIVAASDRLALTIAETCRTVGIRIPDDVALLGVNNDELLCELARPTLSSIDLGAEKIGRDAAAVLDAWITTGRRPQSIPDPPSPRIVARASTGIAADVDPRVSSALSFIRARAAMGIGVRDVLDHVAASRTAVEVGLKQTVGRSIHREIQHQQLLHAQSLLLTSDLSMGEVAIRSGYRTQQHFCRVFHTATGQTPTAFRRQQRRAAPSGR